MSPQIQQTFAEAVRLSQAGRLQEAEALCRVVVAEQPGHAGALGMLGGIMQRTGRVQEAGEWLSRFVMVQTGNPQAWNELGIALKYSGRTDMALSSLKKAIELKPDYAGAHCNLGVVLMDKGELNEAIKAFERAIALDPNFLGAYSNLGMALRAQGRLDAAIAAHRKAIALGPNNAGAQNNLGITLAGNGELDDAAAAFKKAIALQPNFAEAYSNLANVLKDQGDLDGSMAACRQAMAIRPEYADAHDNLILAMQYHPGFDSRAIAEELDRWNRRYAEPLGKLIEPHRNDRDADRRIRVGYLSADFREHPVGRNLLPLIANHDRGKYEIICYAQVSRPDGITARFQKCVDGWRNIVGVSDDRLAMLIRADEIDILVDLALHTAGNRLAVFARKPAPVQATFAGYPGSTGLKTIDYRLSDPHLDPPEMDESIYSELTIRSPSSFWCYDALDEGEIRVNALPARDAGFTTFGCLNNFCKINDGVLALWAKTLRQVANSRLLLLASPGGHRERLLRRLLRDEIDSRRIEFVSRRPHREYLKLYHRIDLGLDTFPYNGHTTSLDSLWMGVPVITLTGQSAVSRAGWSQLSNLGLTDLAAKTPDEFVQIAVDLANDLPRLESLRSSLRNRLERSPLMDGPRFARDVEAAYRRMWQTYCENKPA